LADAAIFTFDKDNLEIRLSDKPSPLLELFAQMAQAYVDTYLVVLLTLEQICGKHIIIKQKLVV